MVGRDQESGGLGIDGKLPLLDVDFQRRLPVEIQEFQAALMLTEEVRSSKLALHFIHHLTDVFGHC